MEPSFIHFIQFSFLKSLMDSIVREEILNAQQKKKKKIIIRRNFLFDLNLLILLDGEFDLFFVWLTKKREEKEE